MKICIATTEIYGPFLTGGIGTANYYLSKLLVSQGHEVTILFTGLFSNKNLGYWKGFYSDLGIELISIEETKKCLNYSTEVDFLNNSMWVYFYLKDKDFDLIAFDDYLALGFISIQAKRTGLSFSNITITLTTHGPSEWALVGSRSLLVDNYPYKIKLGWCERYCCEHTDILISPSQYMFDWALSNNWTLAHNRRVIPNYIAQSEVSPDISLSKDIDFTHLIFFGGAVSTRKGVDIFCLAVEKLLKTNPGSIKKLSFLGKEGLIIDVTVKELSGSYIKRFARRNPGLNIVVKNKLDTLEAMDYIRSSRGIVVIPSRIETFGYTVLECIECKVPFIASSVGGIPEFAPNELLFELNVDALVDKILSVKSLFPREYKSNYSREKIKGQWKDLLEHLPKERELEFKESPKVTICIPYYNTGNYLPTTLKSLEELDYDNYDVVVVDDGSEEEYSKKVFAEMKVKYKEWKFLTLEENSGPSTARNFAVSNSSSEYLTFVDSDDIYEKDFLKDYVRGMMVSGVDCLSAYCIVFKDIKGKPSNYSEKMGIRKYIGPCLELGMLENVFGFSYFFVKRSVFNELGGFDPAVRLAEDWQFLIRLSLRGYKKDVLPKTIMGYRVREASLSTESSLYDMRTMILEEYNAVLPPFAKYLNSYILSSYLSDRELDADFIPTIRGYIADKLKNFPLLFDFGNKVYLFMFALYRMFKRQNQK